MKRCRNCKKFLSVDWHHKLCRACRKKLKHGKQETIVIFRVPKKIDWGRINWSKTLVNKAIWRLNQKYYCKHKDFGSICGDCIKWLQGNAILEATT